MKITATLIILLYIGIIPFKAICKEGEDEESGSSDTTKTEFVFIYSEKEPWKEYGDYSRKDASIFGEVLAQQLCMIDHHYVVYPNSENSYYPNIIKPAIYSSMTKLKQHYKTLLKKDLIDTYTAQEELGLYLIKAYACYNENTEKLEDLLNNAGSVDEIKDILDQITLVTSSE